ncbi:hypothetical protein VNI00_009203 [Paramarasmius palmivorus]|uniref:Uncharacterized protein n=1 Tax=Paramarasmius palmivorus TaxID=297713 RepID=A0AAW0CUH1_9AGAR
MTIIKADPSPESKLFFLNQIPHRPGIALTITMKSQIKRTSNTPVCDAVKGCIIPVDIVLETSDGRLLGAHTKNLETFNRAFPPASCVTHNIQEPVKLTENSEMLRLLLKFSHNEDYGNTAKLGLDKVLEFAAVADKYGNSMAMYACKVAMNRLANERPENAIRVIPYKVVYSDYEDMDQIVRLTMSLPLQDARTAMRHFPDTYMIYVSSYPIQWSIKAFIEIEPKSLYREKYKWDKKCGYTWALAKKRVMQ